MDTVLMPGDGPDPIDMHDARTASPSRRVYFIPVLTLALLLRLTMALPLLQQNQTGWLFTQATELGCLAESVLAGHGLASPFCGTTGPSAFLAPGYPLFVALVFRLFGAYSHRSAVAIVGGQIVIGLLIVFTLMLLTRRLIGSPAANMAGAICAATPAMVCLPEVFWETSMSMLFLTCSLTLALHSLDRPKRRNWVAMGLLFALATLVNPALMLTLVAILGWSASRRYEMNRKSKAAVAGPLLALAVWTMAFAVWPARNWAALHAFVPLRTNLGYELWQGNRPGSDGQFDLTLHPNLNRAERARYAELGELAYMREKSSLAIAAIRADPARFARLCGKRLGRFWTGTGAKKNSPFLNVSLSFTTILAAVGLLLLVRRRPSHAMLLALPLLLFPLPYYVTHADPRFRLVLDPIAIMLGTYALQCLYRRTAKRRRSQSAHMMAPATQSSI